MIVERAVDSEMIALGLFMIWALQIVLFLVYIMMENLWLLIPQHSKQNHDSNFIVYTLSELTSIGVYPNFFTPQRTSRAVEKDMRTWQWGCHIIKEYTRQDIFGCKK